MMEIGSGSNVWDLTIEGKIDFSIRCSRQSSFSKVGIVIEVSFNISWFFNGERHLNNTKNMYIKSIFQIPTSYQIINSSSSILQLFSLLMGKKKFNKKDTVSFTLMPGIDQNGNPSVVFKPVQKKSSKLPEHQKQKIVNQIAGMDIEINGKPVNQSQIPAFILQQIKGRSDLIFNQNHPEMQQDYDEGDLYEEEMIDGEEEEWELDEDDFEKIGEREEEIEEEMKEVEIDGEKVMLTAKQAKLLKVVIPEDYEKYQIKGVEFEKYDEDGNLISESQRQGFERFLAKSNEKRAIVDSYDFVPEKVKDIFDSDLKKDQLKGDMKDLDDALNYEGPEQDYDQLEDDFFSNLLKGEAKPQLPKKQPQVNPSFKKKSQPATITLIEKQKKTDQKIEAPKEDNFHSKYDEIDDDDDEDYEDIEDEDEEINQGQLGEEEEITDQMLEMAIKQFDKKYIPAKQSKIKLNSALLKEEQDEPIIYKRPDGMSLIEYLESKQQFRGKDGQLDWRILTKEEKKQFMKTKKIRDFFDEVRQRQIHEKMQNIKNVEPEDLHLKQYIKHIPYKDDHVLQEALVRDSQEVVDMEASNDEDYETESSEDDIISYRAKTSIISSNLATVEEPSKKKKKKEQKESRQQQESKIGQKVKVVPQKRNKNETKQQRKARKDKLKQMKKMKKQQKKEFGELFDKERKKFIKTQNQHHNVLHKVSHIKIA